jgi:hypothetical protein
LYCTTKATFVESLLFFFFEGCIMRQALDANSTDGVHWALGKNSIASIDYLPSSALQMYILTMIVKTSSSQLSKAAPIVLPHDSLLPPRAIYISVLVTSKHRTHFCV